MVQGPEWTEGEGGALRKTSDLWLYLKRIMISNQSIVLIVSAKCEIMIINNVLLMTYNFINAPFWTSEVIKLNPILHGLFQAGSTRVHGGMAGEGHKVPAAFFSETVKATTIKLGTLTN